MSIYVKDAAGNRTKIAGIGLPGPAGKSAYQYAVEGGFSGTEAEFRALMGVHSNENLLHNWYLADPTNQKGQTEYTGNVYAIDRWRGRTADQIIRVRDGWIEFEQTGNYQADISQIVPNLEGKTITFSVIARGDGTNAPKINVTGMAGAHNYAYGSGNSSSNWQLVSTTVTLPETKEALMLRVYATINTSVKPIIGVYAAKLELGPVQTLAHKEGDTWVLNDPPPNKTLELLKCQYFDVHHLVPRFGEIAKGQAKGGAAVYCTVHLPVPKMRINPILKCDPAQWILNKQGSVASSLPVSSIEIVPAQSYDDVIKLIVTPTDPSLLSTGDVYALMPNVAAGTFAVFELDANL